jgi:hypothetical protein
MNGNYRWIVQTLVITWAVFCPMVPQPAGAQPKNPMDPSLTELGYIPLPDLGLGTYTRDDHTELGGLYPGGWPIRPPELEAVALDIAHRQIQPLDAQGNPEPRERPNCPDFRGYVQYEPLLRGPGETSPTPPFASGPRTIPPAIRRW